MFSSLVCQRRLAHTSPDRGRSIDFRSSRSVNQSIPFIWACPGFPPFLPIMRTSALRLACKALSENHLLLHTPCSMLPLSYYIPPSLAGLVSFLGHHYCQRKRNVSVKDASPIPRHAAVTRAITVTTAPELKPGFLLAHAVIVIPENYGRLRSTYAQSAPHSMCVPDLLCISHSLYNKYIGTSTITNDESGQLQHLQPQI